MARNYLKRELYVFPSDFQGRLMVMLSVLRHEVNQILLAFCFDPPRKKIDFQLIAERFRELTGFKVNLRSYLELLEKSRLLDTTGFLCERAKHALTYAGYDFGRPLATFTIRYSVDNDLSIGDIFGREGLKMTSETQQRFSIFEDLAELEEGRVKEYQLSYEQGFETERKIEIFEDFSTSGLVSQVSFDLGERPYPSFLWIKSKFAGYRLESQNLRKIAQSFLKEPGAKGIEDFVRLSGCPTSEVTNGVEILMEKGYIKPIAAHFSMRRVEIQLTPKGRQFWKEWALPLREFLRSPSRPPKGIIESLAHLSELKLRKEYARKLIRILRNRIGRQTQ